MSFLKITNKNYYIVILLAMVQLAQSAKVNGQGTGSFTSLQQPSFAKIAGLGGVNASLYNGGNSFFIYNPALLASEQTRHLSFSYGLLPGGAGLSNVNHTFNISNIGSFGAALQYLSYGEIQGYDNTGAPTQVFSPNDFTVSLSHARQANNFRLGATVKFSNTAISGFSGNAVLFDIGGVFIHPQKDFTVGMVIKNFGFVTSEFSATSDTKLPFDVQIGTSIKPEHMPIRFSVTLHQLQQWDLMGDVEINDFNTTLDNIFRHMVLAAEIIINQHISLLAGYNHLRRKELKLDNVGSFSGYSIGTSISVRAFQLVYALGGYHVAGNNNTFTLSVNLAEITSKKSKNE